MNTLTIGNAVGQLQEEQQLHVQSQQEQMVNLSSIGELAQEMTDDIASIPKEMVFITLVSQEQALFNPKHEHYRSTQHKDAKWLEIADNVGWTETQCKSKWKALRDQYCRELKRAKLNVNTNVKWKYFKSLDFLRPYALARHYRSRSGNCSNNNVMDTSTHCTSTQVAARTSSYSNNATTLNTAIKLESDMLNCSFAPALTTSTTPNESMVGQLKNDTARLMPTLTAEQINTVIQQQDGNWNYLSSANVNHNSTMTDIRTDQQQSTTIADQALYHAIVDCVTAATGHLQTQPQTQPTQHTQLQPNNEEEDDDPIHTFLNIESYFEKELIALIHQEDILYNNSNQNYRNVKLKLEVWDEIARKLKKSVKQCRQKWKALRDQYIREHKRLKSRDNVESMPRWKHYDALNFLQKFIKQKTIDHEHQTLLQMPKIEIDADMEEPIIISETLPSPHEQQQLPLGVTLPHLTGQSQEATVAAHMQSIEHYDEMDIENYINGDGVGDETHDDDEEEMEEECDDSEQLQQHQSHHQQQQQQQQQQASVELKPTTQYAEFSVNSSSAHSQQSNQNMSNHNHSSTHMGQTTLHIVSNATNNNSNHHTINALEESGVARQHEHIQHVDEFHQPNTPTSSRVDSLSVQTTPNSNLLNSNSTTTTTTIMPASHATDDDEIGAFFKAIAMKIRNANLPPVEFTDLQIDILRVINDSLRNH